MPRLFFGKSKSLSPILGTLNTILVNKYGLGLLNPVTSTNEKYLSSQRAITEFIRGMKGEGNFSNSDHLLTNREERRNRQKIRDDIKNAKLKELVADLDVTDPCIILHAKNTGVWMNAWGTELTDTVLAATGFFFVCTLWCCPP